MDSLNKHCSISGKIMHQISSINELILKYKIKGEQCDSSVVFDVTSGTFCHIINDLITDSIININDQTEGDNDKINKNILIPRRVIFMIDKSGSMSGLKWTKTIESTINGLNKLRCGYDRYEIILFNGNNEYLFNGLVTANKDNILKSIQYLKLQEAGGGTNINDALLAGIDLIKKDIISMNLSNISKYNFYIDQIMFITDGEPNSGITNTNEIILNIQKANILNDIDKYFNKISIFSFGVGTDQNNSSWIKDLNHSFLKNLSLNNNGLYQRIKASNITLLSDYYNILSSPILTNINIKYHNNDIQNITNTKFNTLYLGNDIIICGKLKNVKNPNKSVSVKRIVATISALTAKEIKENNKLITKPIHINKKIINIVNLSQNINNNNNNSNNNIERIWAYLTLQQFAKNKLINDDNINININDDQKVNDNINDDDIISPLSLAIKFKFVTPWTSMIVVKKTIDTKNASVPASTPSTTSAKVPSVAPTPLGAPIPSSAPAPIPICGLAIAPIPAPAPAPIPCTSAPASMAPAPLPGAPLPSTAPIPSSAPAPMPSGAPVPASAPIPCAPLPFGAPPPLGAPLPSIAPIPSGAPPPSAAPLSTTSHLFRYKSATRWNDQDLNAQKKEMQQHLIKLQTSAITANSKDDHNVPDISSNDLGGKKSSNPHHVEKHYINLLHSKIKLWYPNKVGKLTAMFIQNHDQQKIIEYLSKEDRLHKKIDQYVKLLDKSNSFEAYNENGIFIIFNISQQTVKTCHLLTIISNNNDYEIDNFKFMVIVPQYIKLEMKNTNGTKLLPLSQNSIQQPFQLTNTMYTKKGFVFKIQITWTVNGKQHQQKKQITLPW